MGLYTELYVCCELRGDIPPEAVDALYYMAGEVNTRPTTLPSHPLFEGARWPYMLRSWSYYFVPYAVQKFQYNYIGRNYMLIARSDFKNYDDEVSLFFDWLAPMLDCEPGQHIGHYRYEEDAVPTLVFAPNRHVTPKIEDTVA